MIARGDRQDLWGELVQQFVFVGVWTLPLPLGLLVVGEMWRWEGFPLEILHAGGMQIVK